MPEVSIKVIIRDGIVESVLCDCVILPTDVEVIDINKDYHDYQELKDYAEKIYADPEFKELLVTFADFDDHLEGTK